MVKFSVRAMIGKQQKNAMEDMENKKTCAGGEQHCAGDRVQDQEERAAHFPGLARLRRRLLGLSVEDAELFGSCGSLELVFVGLGAGDPHRLSRPLVEVDVVVVACRVGQSRSHQRWSETRS